MSTRAAKWLAWSVCAASLSLFALAFLFSLLGWSTEPPKGWAPWEEQAFGALGFAGAPIVGGLIASRRPANPYGWLWLGLGVSFAMMHFAQGYAAYSLVVDPGALPAPRTVAAVLGQGWVAAIALFAFVLLLFPDGRLPSARWRVLAWVVAFVGALLLIFGTFAPDQGGIVPGKNPLGVGGAFGEAIHALADPGVLILFVAIIVCALSLVFRYRGASGVQRLQIKWFAYAAALNAVLLVVDILGLSGLLGRALWTLVGYLGFAALYLAVGVAILRHRLYDIDVIINRTLVYGSLTATLVTLYLGGIVVLQRLFVLLTGQRSTLAIVASTLAIAALFNPLHRRVQGFVDRRFYRRKYDATKILEAFSARLREETDLDALADDLVGVARDTVQPAHVSLWLHPETAPNDARAG